MTDREGCNPEAYKDHVRPEADADSDLAQRRNSSLKAVLSPLIEEAQYTAAVAEASGLTEFSMTLRSLATHAGECALMNGGREANSYARALLSYIEGTLAEAFCRRLPKFRANTGAAAVIDQYSEPDVNVSVGSLQAEYSEALRRLNFEVDLALESLDQLPSDRLHLN